MSSINIDISSISPLISSIESCLEKDRQKLQDIVNRNKDLNTYEDMVKSSSLVKNYGACADDYSKVCFLKTGVSESILDLKTFRRAILSSECNIPPSLVRTYKIRIDSLVDDLGIFKESIESTRLGLEARVRYYSSCTYNSYVSTMGAKC